MKKLLISILSAILVVNLLLLCSCTTSNYTTSTHDQAPKQDAEIGSSNTSNNGEIEVALDKHHYSIDDTVTATITNHSTNNTYTFSEQLQLMYFDDLKGEFLLLANDSVYNDIAYVLQPQSSTTLTFVISQKFPNISPQSGKLYSVGISFTDAKEKSEDVLVLINFK